MKGRNTALLLLLALIASACIPIPPTTSLPPPTDSPTSIAQTETATPGESITSTPSSTPTETPTSTATRTETPTPTSTETVTPTITIAPTTTPERLTIPSFNDWDAGVLAFSQGEDGDWDRYLWGGFANSLIKKGDTYYLYYQGSPFYDNQCESVAQRSIGVATSTDGINWVKSVNNPVITWSSQGSIEEGATSSAAWLGGDGKVYLYYGANTGTECTVSASARLAVSEDGIHFQDAGEVLSGKDPIIWGAGDEIFPVGAYSYNNQWVLYYIPNGVPLSRTLGVGISSSPSTFIQTLGLNDSTIPAWGPVSIILATNEAVLITNPNGVDGPLDFYRFDPINPSIVRLHVSYALPNCTQASVLYESGTRHWMIACRDQNAENYYIHNAFIP